MLTNKQNRPPLSQHATKQYSHSYYRLLQIRLRITRRPLPKTVRFNRRWCQKQHKHFLLNQPESSTSSIVRSHRNHVRCNKSSTIGGYHIQFLGLVHEQELLQVSLIQFVHYAPNPNITRWPVIAAIIVGSLIVLSILWCIFSCLCCGISLCTACTRCLTCGGCCGACGRSRGGRKDAEYRAMPPTPTPYQGYQPQSTPMTYNNSGPQFATFDARNKNVHEDSLPAMPSWDHAPTRRVEDTTPSQQQQMARDNMEMEHMLPYGRSPPRHEAPYSSDLGAQQQTSRGGYNNDYYDPPRSPAPTYYSTAPVNAPTASGTGAQYAYDTGYSGGSGAMSREGAQFGAGYTPYQQQQESDARPPSMLQIGRRPVPGTSREV